MGKEKETDYRLTGEEEAALYLLEEGQRAALELQEFVFAKLKDNQERRRLFWDGINARLNLPKGHNWTINRDTLTVEMLHNDEQPVDKADAASQ